MVRYKYDAWGNHAVVDTNGNDVTSGIGVINPIRYRGYYYDTETELYYLQSRYYDPEVGRFISADDISYIDPETIFGLNLYAYCNDNPVMYVDPNGEFLISIGACIGLGIGALFALIVGSVEATMHPMQNMFDTFGYYISDAINNAQYEIEQNNTNFIPSIESKYVSLDLNKIEVRFSRDRNKGKDSGFIGLSDEELMDLLSQAKHDHDSELIQRVLKEMKMRGMRNKRKKRGQPHMRGFLLLILLEESLRNMRDKNDY